MHSLSSESTKTFRPPMALGKNDLLAHHISPSRTGHLAWELLVSGDALGCTLKNKIAFPLVGLRTVRLFVQSDHSLPFCCISLNVVSKGR
uniref:Putative prolyl 4-hydroxylase 12 isoform X1 n=1 Tax=Rhizophora mucronata TaxID=61149 RepID=A0A2P2L8I0_RHIMU